MSGPTHQTEAHVLALAPHAGDHLVLTCFCPTDGLLTALLRPARSGAAATAPAPDLFDRLALTLNHGRAAPTGGPWFVREHRLLVRHPALGRSYPTLAAASRLALLLVRNPAPEDSRAALDRLLTEAFAALALPANRPDLVYFKALYRLARDEGLPLKQAWLPALPAPDQALIAAALNQPAASPSVPAPDLTRLTKRLEAYLASEQDMAFA